MKANLFRFVGLSLFVIGLLLVSIVTESACLAGLNIHTCITNDDCTARQGINCERPEDDSNASLCERKRDDIRCKCQQHIDDVNRCICRAHLIN